MTREAVAGGAFRVLAALIVGTMLDAMAGVTGLALFGVLGSAGIWPAGAVHVLASAAGAVVLLVMVWRSDPEAPPPSMLAVVGLVLLGTTAWVSTWAVPIVTSAWIARAGSEPLVAWSTMSSAAGLVLWAVRYGGWMAALILAFLRARPPRP